MIGDRDVSLGLVNDAKKKKKIKQNGKFSL